MHACHTPLPTGLTPSQHYEQKLLKPFCKVSMPHKQPHQCHYLWSHVPTPLTSSSRTPGPCGFPFYPAKYPTRPYLLTLLCTFTIAPIVTQTPNDLHYGQPIPSHPIPSLSYSLPVPSTMATLSPPMALPSPFNAYGTPKQKKRNEGNSWPFKRPRKHEEKDKRGETQRRLGKMHTRDGNQFVFAQLPFLSPTASPSISFQF